MRRSRATLVAFVVVFCVYVLIAWLVSHVTIPNDVPTAQIPWVRPFRVIATLGFAIASLAHLPHLAGQLLAAIVLGAVLGAIYATLRLWLSE